MFEDVAPPPAGARINKVFVHAPGPDGTYLIQVEAFTRDINGDTVRLVEYNKPTGKTTVEAHETLMGYVETALGLGT